MKFLIPRVTCAAGVLFLAAGLAGCGGRGGAKFNEGGLEITMTLPSGWQRGEPRASGGYRASPSGLFFFENSEADIPSGNIIVMPFDGENLEKYVDGLLSETEKMERMQVSMANALAKAVGGQGGAATPEAAVVSRVISRRSRDVGGLEAVEVTTEGSGTALALYVRKGDKVAWISFVAPKDDFARYRAAFLQSFDTVKVK